jgi:hypothetical protein
MAEPPRAASTESQDWIRATFRELYVEHVRVKVGARSLADQAFVARADWAMLVADEIDPTDMRVGKRSNINVAPASSGLQDE